MNTKVIRNHLKDKFHHWVDNCGLSTTSKAKIVGHGFIAGGAIVSLLRNEDPNDYDIYFDDLPALHSIIKEYLEKFDKHNGITSERCEIENGRINTKVPWSGARLQNPLTEEEKYFPTFISRTAMSLTDDVQLIYKYFGDPMDVIKNFDFAHTKCFYIPSSNNLYLSPQALESIVTNDLVYDYSDYPIAALARTRKFVERGWNINAGELLKIAFQVHELDLTDPDTLREQLNGVDIVLFDGVISAIERDLEENPDMLIDIDYINRLVDKYFR